MPSELNKRTSRTQMSGSSAQSVSSSSLAYPLRYAGRIAVVTSLRSCAVPRVAGADAGGEERQAGGYGGGAEHRAGPGPAARRGAQPAGLHELIQAAVERWPEKEAAMRPLTRARAAKAAGAPGGKAEGRARPPSGAGGRAGPCDRGAPRLLRRLRAGLWPARTGDTWSGYGDLHRLRLGRPLAAPAAL